MKRGLRAQLIALGILTEEDISAVLEHSKSTGLRFTEAAINLGFFRDPARLHPMETPSSVNLFRLNPGFFPESTQALLTTDEILKFGALPLGYKKEAHLFRTRLFLNLGLLNPARKEVVTLIHQRARQKDERLSGVRAYLILVDEYLMILKNRYGVSESEVRNRNVCLDETLRTFLHNAQLPRQALPAELI